MQLSTASTSSEPLTSFPPIFNRKWQHKRFPSNTFQSSLCVCIRSPKFPWRSSRHGASSKWWSSIRVSSFLDHRSAKTRVLSYASFIAVVPLTAPHYSLSVARSVCRTTDCGPSCNAQTRPARHMSPTACLHYYDGTKPWTASSISHHHRRSNNCSHSRPVGCAPQQSDTLLLLVLLPKPDKRQWRMAVLRSAVTLRAQANMSSYSGPLIG